MESSYEWSLDSRSVRLDLQRRQVPRWFSWAVDNSRVHRRRRVYLCYGNGFLKCTRERKCERSMILRTPPTPSIILWHIIRSLSAICPCSILFPKRKMTEDVKPASQVGGLRRRRMARRIRSLLGGSVSLEPSCESVSLKRTCARAHWTTADSREGVVSRAKQPPILLLLPYTQATLSSNN